MLSDLEWPVLDGGRERVVAAMPARVYANGARVKQSCALIVARELKKKKSVS